MNPTSTSSSRSNLKYRSSVNRMYQSTSRDGLADSTNDVSESSQSLAKPSKYFGNVTIDIVDDFLTPMSRQKRPDLLNKLKFLPASTSSQVERAGLRENSDDDDEDANEDAQYYSNTKLQAQRYKLFNQRDRAEDFEYINTYKSNYEKQLQDQYEQSLKGQHTQNDTSSIVECDVSTIGDHHSAVGSAMSQVKS